MNKKFGLGFRVQGGLEEKEERVLYLPVGDSLGVPLLALPVAVFGGGGGGGGRGGFSFPRGGSRGGGAKLFRPHLGGAGEYAAGGIESAGIHHSGGGGVTAATACARPGGEGERGSNVMFQLLQGPFCICQLALPRFSRNHLLLLSRRFFVEKWIYDIFFCEQNGYMTLAQLLQRPKM